MSRTFVALLLFGVLLGAATPLPHEKTRSVSENDQKKFLVKRQETQPAEGETSNAGETETPSNEPAEGDTETPTEGETNTPTGETTDGDSGTPTGEETNVPTEEKTGDTEAPTGEEINTPTGEATGGDAETPTGDETNAPTGETTGGDAEAPTGEETSAPTGEATGGDTEAPTGDETNAPTGETTGGDAEAPTGEETNTPTGETTGDQTGTPTGESTGGETDTPSGETETPTGEPTGEQTNADEPLFKVLQPTLKATEETQWKTVLTIQTEKVLSYTFTEGEKKATAGEETDSLKFGEVVHAAEEKTDQVEVTVMDLSKNKVEFDVSSGNTSETVTVDILPPTKPMLIKKEFTVGKNNNYSFTLEIKAKDIPDVLFKDGDKEVPQGNSTEHYTFGKMTNDVSNLYKIKVIVSKNIDETWKFNAKLDEENYEVTVKPEAESSALRSATATLTCLLVPLLMTYIL